jgi:hypothetical protein
MARHALKDLKEEYAQFLPGYLGEVGENLDTDKVKEKEDIAEIIDYFIREGTLPQKFKK